MGYNTKQKSAVLDCLARHKSESLTVDGVCAALAADGVCAGRSTVYRHLEELCREGAISRFAAERGKSATYRVIGSECGDDYRRKRSSGTGIQREGADRLYRHTLQRLQRRV